MAPPSVTVGGKDASLSPAVVYAIASGLRSVKIDSAAFDKLSQSKKPTSLLSPPSPSSPLPPTLLPSPSARAALLVLLSKLLLPSAAARPAIPHLLEKTLTLLSSLDSLDFASPLSLLTTLRELAGSTIDSIELTASELMIIESSPFASTAICAMLDHSVTSLARVADAVAALSCEAARANVSDADCAVGKYQAEVASAMKELLHGSKLVGQTESSAYASIPAVHGRFCKGVKILHEGVREELRSSAKIEKRGGQANYEGEEDLLAVVLPIALAIGAMGRISLDRAKAVVELISDQDMRVKVGEAIEHGCPKFDELRKKVDRFRSVDATCRADYILAFQNVYEAMSILRQMIAWEAALALFALEIDESVEKAVMGPQASVKENGEGSKGDKKSKKSKKKTLGKGTSVVRQLILEQLVYRNQTAIGDVGVMAEWARKLALYFDPKDIGLDAFLLKVKEILESNDARRLPKIPKGTRDFGKEQMAIRERAFAIIQRVFKMHGATALDTPVFELRETLMGKYGEDSKLIYDLADQGGELCSLRYDLTVPFARYLAMNNVSALKRYQVAKVYRRDNPSKGRYREFYQCDFDIAGQYETMEPDFEVVKVLTQLLDQLDIGDYEIKLNHRKLLDGMLDICGVSSDKFRTVCSSIDKLDKQLFEQVKKELVEEKGLAVETAEKIGTFVSKRGQPLEILSDLKSEGSQFLENNGSMVALNELEILFKALEKCKCLHRVVFDLSLARGLDYYTGVIFEAIFKGTTQVGSIAAGGRYDNLVGMFSGKQVPAVGVSLGIERVFTIMEQLEKDRNQVIRATETQVLVAILGKDVTLAAELVGELWDAGISAEFGLTKRVMNHINRAKQSGIPWMVIMGESEISAGVVNLKDIEASQEYVVPRAKMVEELKSRLNLA